MSRWREQRDAEMAAANTQAYEESSTTLEDVEKEFQESLKVDDALKAFAERRTKEKGRMHDICDTSYYFTVCFSNVDQLAEFCDSVGLDPDKMYFDGKEFAKAIGKAIKTPDLQLPKEQGISPEYVKMSRGRIALDD